MKSILGGGAIIATALFSGSLIFFARPLAAETLISQIQEPAHQASQASLAQKQESKGPASPAADNAEVVPASSLGELTDTVGESEQALKPAALPPSPYLATAYSLRGRTANGSPVSKGVIAADPRLLPLGSHVRIEAGLYSGDYLVADTGGSVRGRRVDIWTPTTREAVRFGRRRVKLTVLSYGPKQSAARKRANR
jgi:3D (Asp-Asp-Asp) domain-containing protein